MDLKIVRVEASDVAREYCKYKSTSTSIFCKDFAARRLCGYVFREQVYARPYVTTSQLTLGFCLANSADAITITAG